MNSRIDTYADLLVRTGLNLRSGMNLVISCPVECAPFARICAEKAYAAGCREVIMNWSDDALSRLKYLHADDSVFDSVHPWTADFYNKVTEKDCAWLAIHASDPEALSGVPTDRIRRASIASGEALKPFRDRQMMNWYPWCVASIPTVKWAKKVFPNLSDDDAVLKLWELILDCTRVYENGDAKAEWDAHIAKLKARVKTLNDYNFKSLHYKNSLGTDLTIDLPEHHFWEGGGEKTSVGHDFCANMPTEEVFTAPHRDSANGIVYASKPLVVNGDVADGFSFTFENGKIVKVEAERGKELLEAAISVDEGAAYLGEIALVPYDSPISRSGVLFYNTLFDENASCHLAFGEAYPCIRGGAQMTREQQKEAGLNYSIAHDDFMIGTPDLSITGTTHDGREIPVFVNGNFAF